MEEIKVSVVITNWNGRSYLERCLFTVFLQTYKNFEVIVVDDNSSDDSCKLIAQRFPQVRLIRNNRNYGFAKSNNIGIRQAKGECILTLNNDTELVPECIENMVKAIEKDANIGMCASKILLYNRRNLIDSAGMMIYADGLAVCRGHLEDDADYRYNREEEVLLPTACAALYRKQAIIDAGFFDDNYFAYSEDTDLGLRIQMLRYRCIYVPTARVYHYYSASMRGNIGLKLYLCERNRLRTVIKCYSFRDLLFSFYYTWIRYMWYIYAYIKKQGAAGNFSKHISFVEIIAILFKVYISLFWSIGGLFRKRLEILYNNKMEYKSIYRLPEFFKISAKGVAFQKRVLFE